jgi:hypothetical protein
MEHEIFGHGFLLNTQKNEEVLSNIDPKHKIQTLIDDIGKQNIIRIKEFCKNNDEIDLCKLKDFNAVISGFYDYEKLKILRKFDNLIKKQVGLGFHSLDNYGEDSYPEVYAEYREQSIDRRTILANKKDLNKEYSYPTNVYRRLTQICLDINDCTKDEYEKIMKVKCRTQECIEFRCIEYKLLCCRNFKNSPNCG